jgi:hypothetical protein
MPDRRKVAMCIVGLAAVGIGGRAVADEGGVPFWLSGQFASFAAVPPSPGFSMPVMVFYDNGSADRSKTFERAGIVVSGLNSSTPVIFLSPTFVPNVKVLRGRPSLSLGFGGGYASTSAGITGPMGNQTLERTNTVWGITDLGPLISLSWASGVNNGMAYVAGAIPVGAYEKNRLSNIGIGHGAIDLGGGYTYLDQKTGLEASAVAGFTFNLEDPSTAYKNGIDWHLDWAVSRLLSQSFRLGVVGYLYLELPGDSGSGDRVGPFKSDVAAVGAEGGYFFKVAGKAWDINLRGYGEFWSVHREQGFSIVTVLNVPLWIPE